MNWLTKAINFGEKIKKVLRKRPSKEDIANSDWTSCCKGPILKKDLENNLWSATRDRQPNTLLVLCLWWRTENVRVNNRFSKYDQNNTCHK